MKPFELILFSVDSAFIREAVAAGVQGVIVDWEQYGKRHRQFYADTEINAHTADDLRRVRDCTDALVVCRINGLNPATAEEVEKAIQCGADEILLPMVRTVQEVQTALSLVAGRCGLGIMIETKDAIAIAEQLGRLPLTRAFVGLQDLAIERKTPNLFTAVAEGLIASIRPHIRMKFGWGGLTLPECGHPIPCRYLMGELVRLDTNFTFLRRSFHRDIKGRDMRVEVPRMLQTLQQMRERPLAQQIADHRSLLGAIAAWHGNDMVFAGVNVRGANRRKK